MSRKRGDISVRFSERELGVLEGLAAHHEMTQTAVLRQALRLYQQVHERLRGGERMYFSGDEKRSAMILSPGLGDS